jgi:DNA-binding response OmpR family regulator
MMANKNKSASEESGEHDRPYVVAIDDNPDILQTFKAVLKDAGYRVDVLPSGIFAHQLLEERRPDLAIIDVMMERQDSGWLVVQGIRRDPLLAELSIVVCTADDTFARTHASQLQELGCHILPKPFDVDELLEVISAALDNESAA